ncbi:Der GTPase-activating protein YihI [Shewanella sp. NIFS-20-20]|uniref:Der GTPase-activating protein YihI n=1 Tax=Shewanella sp. NIFS-20-20 TaxID=2853806 RepID=UPI001C44CEEE|nr:Der GTPase-activating protein YihI [Shewanella sp. NIFS-20-20]MBV7316108.1 Der GTPase-activating protein YihI [Shewanella sp. NIFS-20-20]
MSRSKKTRSGLGCSPTKAPRQKKTERELAKKKRSTGNKTGSRHNEGLLQTATTGNAAKKDPRHGSKKPIALTLPNAAVATAPVAVKTVHKPKLTDEQKLLKLEEDPRLNQLLDALEEGRDLNNADQEWLDKQLNKIEALMAKLGITDVEDETPAPKKARSDDELLAQFESGESLLDQYRQKD